MNRREFLKTLGAAAAIAYAMPVSALTDEVVRLGAEAPESVEWHNLFRKYGVDITDPMHGEYMRLLLTDARAVLDRKCATGWRAVGAEIVDAGYNQDAGYSWVRVTHRLVPIGG
jgi:hypothetical protein